jgi:glycosyltransferase involved in cell wall biosynthesis
LREFDLYFNPTLGIPFLARIIALNVKLVVTIHDMIPFFFPKKYSRRRGALVKAMSLYAARAAHCVITVSENSKNDIVALASVPDEKVTVVYNFISPPYFLNNEVDNKFFLCISTLEPGKNVESAILGFGEFIRRTKAPYKFYWVGRVGWVYTREYVEQLVKNENLEDHFVLMGYVTEDRKKELLRTCTAIVYLSHYEGFGLPVLEGMAYNKVAIVSNNSSLPEVVGEAGVVCNGVDVESISDALKNIVANRNDLEKKIPAQLDKFSPKVQIELFNETLQKLLQ